MSVTLTRASDGTTHKVQTHLISRRSAGGTLHQTDAFATQDVYDFRFENLTKLQRDNLMAFLIAQQARQITIVDSDGQSWLGYVISKIVTFTQKIPNKITAGCAGTGIYSLQIEFEGVEQ